MRCFSEKLQKKEERRNEGKDRVHSSHTEGREGKREEGGWLEGTKVDESTAGG